MAFESFNQSPSGKLARSSYGMAKSFFSGPGHQSGVRWAKESVGLGKGMSKFGRALGVAVVAHAAYQGYQQDGLTGAVVAGGTVAAQGYAFGRILHGIATLGPVGLTVATVAAAAGAGLYATAKVREIGKERYRAHSRLEMGAPVLDQFGSIATMRQRSLQALNNSRLNGMTALGNEAALMYRTYSR